MSQQNQNRDGDTPLDGDSKQSNAVPQEKERSQGCWWRIARLALIVYATVLVLLVIMESRLVYLGAFMKVPAQIVQDVETVTYDSADGTALTGQLCENPNAQYTLLFFHGNGITAEWERPNVLSLSRQLNANVLAAEYRGYGDCDGSPNEDGLIEDAFAARDYLCQRYNIQPNELILYGQSLGGGIATAVAADTGAKLLILDRTFDRMVDVAANRYWFMPIRFLMRNRYDSIGRIESYDGPIVQWHGKADRLIPIHHGRRLHEAAPTDDKVWLEIDNMGHNDPLPPTDWQRCRRAIVDALRSKNDE